MEARARIQADLADLRRRRALGFLAFTVLLSLLVLGLVLAPQKSGSIPRGLEWMLSLGAVALVAALAMSATLGLPLWSERALSWLTVSAGLGLAGALALIVEWDAPATIGLACVGVATAVSAVAMVAIGAATGTLWRRFPDPGWLLAISVASLSVLVLHFDCGETNAVHVYGFHLGPMLLAYGLARVAVSSQWKLQRSVS
jgi:hypothetical protein